MTPSPGPRSDARGLWLALSALSVVALVVRAIAARLVGFGDSEALYASYALYPQPAYLDHPGLIGIVDRALAHAHGPAAAFAPSPPDVHAVTAVAATLAPFAVVLACKLLGAGTRGALGAALAVAVAPEVAVGLFGMTPDLPLFFAWLAALALFGRALLSQPGSTSAAALFAAAGLALGVACAAKVSGLTLGLAFAVALLAPSSRAHRRTLWPWTTLALAALIFSPVVLFEARTGWPMLRHRLIDTQHDASLSVRNAVAVLSGQVAYVSPVLFVAGVLLGRRLLLASRESPVTALLAAATFVPLAVLGALCLWSRVAEPHWLAPAWLALPLYFACDAAPASEAPGPRLRTAGVLVALAASALVYAWVLVPSLVALVPPASYDARLDIANELYGWPEVAADVVTTFDRERAATAPEEPVDVVVIGSVWMVCAQLRAALPAEIPVGCAGPDTADFATWSPPRAWAKADLLLFVHDNRAPADSAALFPDRTRLASRTRTIRRGGLVARTFTLELLAPRGLGQEDGARESPGAGAIGESPASRRSDRSSDSAAFGVVRSLSP